MSMEVMNYFEEDMKLVIAESRILAIDAKHDAIGLEHLFVAILNTNCKATAYLSSFEAAKHIAWLKKLYLDNGTQTMQDSLPLTIHVERIIKHACHLASLKQQPLTNSVHLLLAMLSYENRVSELVKKKGLIFEDIADSYFPGGLPKTPIEIQLRHFRKPTFIGRLLSLDLNSKKLLKDIYEHAENLRVYQQYNDCLITCQTGLKLAPDHKDLKMLSAICFYKKGDYENAIICYKELAASFPGNPHYLFDLALSYSKSDNHLKAEEILDQLLVKIPDNTSILNNKGFNLYQQGRYAEAIPFYERAILVDPSFAYPLDNLGFVKYKLGDTEQALHLIDKSLELDKGNSFAYKYKGIIFLEKGDKAQALHNFQLALRYGYTQQYGEEVQQLIEQCK